MYGFKAGTENPADCVTHTINYIQFKKSNYVNDPKDLTLSDKSLSEDNSLNLTIPNLVQENNPSKT